MRNSEYTLSALIEAAFDEDKAFEAVTDALTDAIDYEDLASHLIDANEREINLRVMEEFADLFPF